MGKQRWRRTPDPGEKVPPKPAVSSKRRGRWQEKPDQAVKKSNRSPLKIFAGLFALAIVLALIVVLILLLVPPARPHLTILSASYKEALLDPNAFASADAAAIQQATAYFDAGSANSGSQTRDEMIRTVSSLKAIQPSRPWFGSQPTIAVVYVNAVGVALWQESSKRSIPFLIPGGFDVPTKLEDATTGLVSVADLLDNFAESPAERKILILDCQRVDTLWPMGVLSNEFVDAVQDQLRDLSTEKKKGLFVLATCSPGEVTWVERSSGRSLFAKYFLEALGGKADGRGSAEDEFVTLGEAVRYVTEKVRSDSAAFADVQTPTLLCGEVEDADEIRLASVNPSWLPRWLYSAPAAVSPPTVAATNDSVLDQLQEGWKEYFALAQSQPPPWRLSPLDWRAAEETLCDAEQRYRAGDIASAEEALDNLDERLRVVRSLKDPVEVDKGVGDFSLPMYEFVRFSQSPSPEGAAAKVVASDFSQLVRTVTGPTDFVTAARAMEDRPGTKPIEAYLAMQLAHPDHGPARWDPGRARPLVDLRVRAEQSIVQGERWTPAAMPWFRRLADSADQGRRLLEDEFLAEPAREYPTTRVRIGENPSPVPIDRVERDYGAVGDRGRILAAAYEARERALADLPKLMQFIARRPWGKTWRDFVAKENKEVHQEDDFRQKTSEEFGRLLESLKNLNSALLIDPAGLETLPDQADDPLRQQIGVIQTSTTQLLASRKSLLEWIEKEIGLYANAEVAAQTEVVWRRIHDLMLIPIASDRDPAKAARQRVNLLKRLCQPVQRVEGKEVVSLEDVTAKERLDRVRQTASLARTFYATALGKSGESLDASFEARESPTEIGALVAMWWRQMRATAVRGGGAPSGNKALSRSELLQAETALRLIEGLQGRVDFERYDVRLRKLDMANFLHWQATRYIEDFWARWQDEKEHYFEHAGKTLLTAADKIHPSGGEGKIIYQQTQDRLDDLVRKANGTGAPRDVVNGGSAADESKTGEGTGMALQSDTRGVAFRLRNEEQVRFDVTGTEWQSLPAGFGVLFHRVAPPGAPLESEAKRTTDERSEEVVLRRRGNPEGRATLDTILRYRGHRRNLVLDVDLSDGSGGPGVVYDGIPDSTARYSVKRSGKQGTKLLFVLDCSASMNASDSVSLRGNQKEPRIRTLKSVLKEFQSVAAESQMEVGIRLFGADSTPERPNAEQIRRASADTKRVLPLGPFDETAFSREVNNLRNGGPGGGFTPLFHALGQVLRDGDFRGKSGDLEIILITDGVDSTQLLNDALQKQGEPLSDAYTLERVLAEYRASGLGIHIHTIGFQLTDEDAVRAKSDLETLSRETGGRFFLANDARKLKEHIESLGTYKYAALKVRENNSLGEQVPDPAVALKAAGTEHSLATLGFYEVQVTGSNALLAKKRIDARRGSLHRLMYRAGGLDYDPDYLPTKDDPIDTVELGPVTLYLFPAYRDQDGGAVFEFALYDASNPLWDPGAVHVWITPRDGSSDAKVCHFVAPNVANVHYPRWKLKVEAWPDAASRATMQVYWGAASEPVSVDLGRLKSEVVQIKDNVRIGGYRFVGPAEGGNRFEIKLDFEQLADKTATAQRRWYIDPIYPILRARQVYNVGNRIHKADFVLEASQEDIRTVRVYSFEPTDAQKLELSVDVRRN